MTLNPNSPTLVGSEWFPTRQRGLGLDRNRVQAAVLTPGAVATDDIAVNLRNVAGSPMITAEIIPVGSIAAPTTTITRYAPSGDSGFTGASHAGGGTVAPFYVDLDENPIDLTDYVTNKTTTDQIWGLFFASGGFSTGRRVLNVTFSFVAQTVAGVDTTLLPWFSDGTTKAYDSSGTSAHGVTTVTSGQNTFNVSYNLNPITGLAWTVADVVSFASTATFGFDLYAGVINNLRVYQAWINVTWLTETRLAVGSITGSTGGWTTITMATPAGVDTWTPTAATQYAVILSVSGDGSASWRGLDSNSAHPEGNYSALVSLSDDGYPASLGTTDTAAVGIVGLDATGRAVWGQPYVTITEEPIYTGRVVQQEVTLPDTASRGSLRFVARQQSAATTASLVAKLKRRSDDVQVGGTVTVTPFDIRTEPLLAQSIWLPGASGAAGSAAQHYVEWSCTGASGDGWLLTTLDVDNVADVQGLTTNQQGLETNTTGWTAGANTTIARSTAQHQAGAASLSLTNVTGVTHQNSAEANSGSVTAIAVTGGLVTASAYYRSDVNTRTARLGIRFYTSGSALISTTFGADITTSTSAWTAVTASAPCPSNAAYVTLLMQVDATGAGGGEAHYGDTFSLLQGNTYEGLTFGGTTDIATIAGTDTASRDVPVVVGTTRTAPAGQAVAQA